MQQLSKKRKNTNIKNPIPKLPEKTIQITRNHKRITGPQPKQHKRIDQYRKPHTGVNKDV